MNIRKEDRASDEALVHKWFEFVSKWEKSVQDRKKEEEGAKKCTNDEMLFAT